MGLKITKQVWEHSRLNGSDKLMLLALADHADDDGFCWPSYVTLSELTGTNPGPKNDCRQAKRTMNNLRKSGELIIWEQQGQHGGRGYTNLYLIITGLSEQEVFEIITRRFELTAAEVPSVITKKGDVYTTLSYLKRVTSETLLRTREAKKGGIDDVQVPERVVSRAQKGGMDTTRTIREPSIKPSEAKKIPPKGGGKPLLASTGPESRAMFSALAQVCGLDIKLLTEENRGALNQAEKIMRENGYNPADLVAFGGWWLTHDWRGKQGDEPSLTQIRETWGRFRKWQQGNGHLGDSPPDPIPPPVRTPEQLIWQQVLADSPQIPQWLAAEIKPIQRSNGTFKLAVSSDSAKQWIDNRLVKVIRPTLNRIDQSISEIEVIVDP